MFKTVPRLQILAVEEVITEAGARLQGRSRINRSPKQMKPRQSFHNYTVPVLEKIRKSNEIYNIVTFAIVKIIISVVVRRCRAEIWSLRRLCIYVHASTDTSLTSILWLKNSVSKKFGRRKRKLCILKWQLGRDEWNELLSEI